MHIVVRNEYGSHVARVVETYDHGGNTYAKVEIADSTGFVELPDNPKSPTPTVVCVDCGREETTSDEPGPLRKQNECNNSGSARVLRDLHASRRPSHSPRIELRA